MKDLGHIHVQHRVFRYSTLLTVIILGVASFFPLFAASRHIGYLNDDSYITLTYAKNLAAGRGFVYNHPPATQGTTTPLFTLAVAGLALVLPKTEIATIAVFLGAFCWIATVWTLFLFRKDWRLLDWQAAIVGLVVIGTGWIAFLGMEAYLFALLLVLSISLFFSERYLLTGFSLGLLVLTRGEGILVLIGLLPIAAMRMWRRTDALDIAFAQPFLNLAIGFAAPVLLWFIYAYSTFGSFLPNTLAAKQAQGQSLYWRTLLQRLVREWMPHWGNALAIKKLPAINFWWAIILVGIMTSFLEKRRWLVLLVWIILYIVGYTLLDVSAYWWYQLPILFVLQLFFALGLIKCTEVLGKIIGSRTVSLTVSVLLVAVLLFLLTKPTIDTTLSYQGDSRGPSYVSLGRWFRDNTASTESIAFIEIGYLGYYTDNRIVDLAGLTLPDVVPHVAENDFAWGFWKYRPDYYIFSPDYDWALADIRADSRFEQEYRSVATLPGPRETDFVVYKRISQ